MEGEECVCSCVTLLSFASRVFELLSLVISGMKPIMDRNEDIAFLKKVIMQRRFHQLVKVKLALSTVMSQQCYSYDILMISENVYHVQLQYVIVCSYENARGMHWVVFTRNQLRLKRGGTTLFAAVCTVCTSLLHFHNYTL